MIWKCAQIDQNPSKYFSTNYQSLKFCLKKLRFWAKTTKSKVEMCCNRLDVFVPETDKMMSVQVYTFRYRVHIQRPNGLAVKASGIRVYDLWDLGSIPEKVIFLKFWISLPMIFSHVLGHIYTHLGCYYHNYLGLVGVGVGLMTLRLLVRSHVGRITDLINPWGELKWVRLEQWRS
jgi:hypothetical protein